MRLYLIRHGQPNNETIDPQKGLSPVGQQEIELLASILQANNISVKEIWHSDKTRAVQTASILSTGIKMQNGLLEKKGLGPTDRPEPIVGQIFAAGADLLIVTHMPLVSKLASLLLTGDDFRLPLNFDAGAMACLNFTEGHWHLEWFAYPRLFKRGDLLDLRSYH